MKINEDNNPNQEKQSVDAWWKGLSKEEKEFNFELGQFLRGLESGKFKLDAQTEAKMRRGLRKALKKLDAACSDVALKVFSGDPQQYRWN